MERKFQKGLVILLVLCLLTSGAVGGGILLYNSAGKTIHMSDCWSKETLEAMKELVYRGDGIFGTVRVDDRDSVAEKLERGFAERKPFHLLARDVRGGVSVISLGRGTGAGEGVVNNYPDIETAKRDTERLDGMSPEFANAVWIE